MNGKVYSSCMLHSSEIWPVKKENELALLGDESDQTDM